MSDQSSKVQLFAFCRPLYVGGANLGYDAFVSPVVTGAEGQPQVGEGLGASITARPATTPGGGLVLMSQENPYGWKLEDLLMQLCTELEAKNRRIGDDSSPVARRVKSNNELISFLLLDARVLQFSSLEALNGVGPDRGPFGNSRIGTGSEV